MFRKALLSIALLAVLLTTFAPVHADTPKPTTIRILAGEIAFMSGTDARYLAVTVSPLMRPVRVYLNKDTLICLGGQPINFSELRAGDSVKVTLHLNTSRLYVAQLVEAFRKGSDSSRAANVISPACGLWTEVLTAAGPGLSVQFRKSQPSKRSGQSPNP